MSWISIVGAVLKLLVMVLGNKFERDKERKRKKEVYLEKARQSIKRRDASAITTYFDSVRRL